ncbi:protein of unknown function [Hymenobacter gelipurpurascens]|uniref:DUF4476 domain-containing protein n=1 Tax=Hymenobacter gelipurpurascens TaxID=89968 RepID=A0A212UFT8_9BACT|nr:DUF4476 domain-containing protein [Hymenobacter gelipurpurascens]SNC77095.1 protein of unknown function [Hymenobacter gelipurpurascens]
MKKALLLFASLFLFLVGGLQAAPANVNFSSERGVPFQLVFDGRALTRGGARQVFLDRLMPGYHWAEFIIPSGYGRSVNYRTQIFLDGGLETNFVLFTRNGYPPMLRKVSAIPIRGNYPPGRPGNGYPTNGGYDNTYPGGPAGPGRNDGGYPAPNSPYPNQGPYPNGPAYPSQPAYPNTYPDNRNNYNVMSPQDVSRLLQSVQRQSFDDNKLPILREALGAASLESDDLTRILSTLTFDRNRVELAKYAYPRIVDPQNFYRVYEAFDFQSNVQELQQYVQAYRR